MLPNAEITEEKMQVFQLTGMGDSKTNYMYSIFYDGSYNDFIEKMDISNYRFNKIMRSYNGIKIRELYGYTRGMSDGYMFVFANKEDVMRCFHEFVMPQYTITKLNK